MAVMQYVAILLRETKTMLVSRQIVKKNNDLFYFSAVLQQFVNI